MNIDDLTIGQAKELAANFGGTDQPSAKPRFDHSMNLGSNVLIRTVTMHYTGQIIGITSTDIVLADAAWIADTGRYSNALKTGELSEVEPYPDGVIVSRSVIVDIAPWAHDLPREVK